MPLRVYPVRLLFDLVPELLVEQRALLRPAALLQATRWSRIAAMKPPASGSTTSNQFRLYRGHSHQELRPRPARRVYPSEAIAELS